MPTVTVSIATITTAVARKHILLHCSAVLLAPCEKQRKPQRPKKTKWRRGLFNHSTICVSICYIWYICQERSNNSKKWYLVPASRVCTYSRTVRAAPFRRACRAHYPRTKWTLLYVRKRRVCFVRLVDDGAINRLPSFFFGFVSVSLFQVPELRLSTAPDPLGLKSVQHIRNAINWQMTRVYFKRDELKALFGYQSAGGLSKPKVHRRARASYKQ